MAARVACKDDYLGSTAHNTIAITYMLGQFCPYRPEWVGCATLPWQHDVGWGSGSQI